MMHFVAKLKAFVVGTKHAYFKPQFHPHASSSPSKRFKHFHLSAGLKLANHPHN